MKKQYEMICGCHVAKTGNGKGIVFCAGHSKVNEMAGTLNMIRGYFLESMGAEGEQSPFVQMIDKLIPRR